MQNNGIECFDLLTIEKVQAIRLSTNLLYKLWKDIIATAIYLYNEIFCASNN